MTNLKVGDVVSIGGTGHRWIVTSLKCKDIVEIASLGSCRHTAMISAHLLFPWKGNSYNTPTHTVPANEPTVTF